MNSACHSADKAPWVLPRELSFYLIRPENHVPWNAIWQIQNSKQAVMCLLVKANCSVINSLLMKSCWDARLSSRLSHQVTFEAMQEWPSWPRPILFNCSIQPSLPTPVTAPAVSSIFHFTNIEVAVLLGTLRALEMVSYPCSNTCFTPVLSPRSTEGCLDVIACLFFYFVVVVIYLFIFLSWHAVWELQDLTYTGLCISKLWSVPTVGHRSIKVRDTS